MSWIRLGQKLYGAESLRKALAFLFVIGQALKAAQK